jgi:hypothetical protein
VRARSRSVTSPTPTSSVYRARSSPRPSTGPARRRWARTRWSCLRRCDG